MATTGAIEVNLNNIRDTINNSTTLAEGITGGISAQGSDIGTAVGVTITVLFYIALIVVVLGIIFIIFNWVKDVRDQAKGFSQ